MNAATRTAGLRRRGEAPHHARHLRPVGGLLRRLLRQGAEGPHAASCATSTRPTSSSTCCCRPRRPRTAFPLGAKTADPLTMYLNDVCTIPSNLAGHPAMSVPFGVGDDGLPVGVQVLAPTLGEPTMFRAAAALEARTRRSRCRRMSRRPDGGGRLVIGLEVHVRARHRDQAVLRPPPTSSATSPTPTSTRSCLGLPGSLPVLNEHAVELSIRTRSGPELSGPAVASSPGRTTSIPTCRRTTRSPSTTVRSTSTVGSSCPTAPWSASSGPTSRRTPASPPTSVAAVASTTPSTPWSTTTGPACRCVEIVSRPDIRIGRAGQGLRRRSCAAILVAIGASDAKMEEGSMRVDANVSVRPAGSRRAAHALRDQERQLAALPRCGRSSTRPPARSISATHGEAPRQETRHWDEAGRTHHAPALARRRPRTTATSPSPTWCRSNPIRHGSNRSAPPCRCCRRLAGPDWWPSWVPIRAMRRCWCSAGSTTWWPTPRRRVRRLIGC